MIRSLWMKKPLDLQSGFLHIYHLNKQAKRSEIGKAPPSPDSGFAFIV